MLEITQLYQDQSMHRVDRAIRACQYVAKIAERPLRGAAVALAEEIAGFVDTAP